jgi:hypothetical protein
MRDEACAIATNGSPIAKYTVGIHIAGGMLSILKPVFKVAMLQSQRFVFDLECFPESIIAEI